MKGFLIILCSVIFAFGARAQNITGAEYFFNTDPGIGNGINIPVSNADSLLHNLTFSTTGLSEGFHRIWIRTRDLNGKWSIYMNHMFYVYDPIFQYLSFPRTNLVAGEYFFDTDPGVGNGTPVAFAPNDTVTQSINASVTGLAPGFHHLWTRTKDAEGQWAIAKGIRFYVYDTTHTELPTTVSTLVAAEYFVDTDPGVGNGISIPIPTADTVLQALNIDVSPYSIGTHRLYIRTKNNFGQWALWSRKEFNICSSPLDLPVITGNTAACQNENFVLSGGLVTDATSYFWKGPNNLNQVGNDLTLNNIQLSQAGAYTFYAVRTGGTTCDTSKITVNVAVNPVYTSNNPQTVCFGESYTINGNTYIATGTYVDTFQTINACDSIVTTVLTVLPELLFNNDVVICNGESITIGTNTYSTSGTYIDNLTSVNGCDSTITTILTVAPVHSVTNNAQICTGGSYNVGTSVYTDAGTYTDVLQSSSGCDSTVTTILTVVSSFEVNNPQTICEGESITVGTNTYSTAGTYTDLFQSTLGCDSTVTTILTVNPIHTVNNPQTICFGESYSINSNTYTIAGNYTDTLTSSLGCDSLVVTVLTVLSEITVTNPQTICEGESITIGTNTYSTSGTYIDNLISVNGCDSTVTTILTVAPIHSVTTNAQICTGGTYTVGASVYTDAGTYTDVLQSSSGCDSTVTTILTVVSSFEVNNPQTICEGESITVGSNTYSTAGTYTDLLQSTLGCDSTVTTILTVNPISNVTNTITLCQGETINVGTNTYSVTGTYTDVFQAVNGCDSTIVTILTVNPVYAVNNPQTICVGESITVGTNTYSTTGTYTNVLQSVNGCDSTVTTVLTVQNPTLNTAVSINGTTLTAIEVNASYQWVDCNNNNVYIAGATLQSYTPTVNGSYAVILTSTQCEDVTATSPCYTINSVGIEDIGNFGLSLYPNPVQTLLTITAEGTTLKKIVVMDVNGKIILTEDVSGISSTIDVKSFSRGIYLIKVESEAGTTVKRFEKN